MIERVEVRDFAVARDVAVEPGPGLNVFTGETGAGKSLIVDALAFAFGARRGREVVATGADRAEVTVRIGPATVVERSVGLSGRTSARIDGAPATVEALLGLGSGLEIHGQSEHLAVLRPAVQLATLDRYAGSGGMAAEFAGHARELREVRRALASLVADSRERERRLEQLRYEVEEIAAAAPRPGEDAELRAEHARLSTTSRRIADVEEALAALEAAPIGEVGRAAAALADRDPDATPLLDSATLLETLSADLARSLRRYREGIEDDPERLAAVGERLDLLARLKRKYGDTLEEVAAYASGAAGEIERLAGTGYSAEDLGAREIALVHELSRTATNLSAARRRGAARLVAAVRTELGHLGMGAASLAVGFSCDDDPDGIPCAMPDYEVIGADEEPAPWGEERFPRAFTESGLDRVEFLASFNPGEAARPLAAVASGGETSRFLLALTTVLGAAAGARVIVLDEVDEGVGGRSGALVGEALARLASHHQVLCVTHLPQVAAWGDRHFVVAKRTDGTRTWSEITEVAGAARVEELASMLGGTSAANEAAARELLSRVAEAGKRPG